MANAVGIIFSSLNTNTLSRLTGDRTVAAIPFGCRYRLVDFCLSNMVNADISNIFIVANYNYRSLLQHIGSGKDWDLARRKSGINFISPFQTAANSSDAKMFSTRLEALKSMRSSINEFTEDYVVMMDSDNVLNIDLGSVIDDHEKSGANITLVTMGVNKSFSSKHPRMMLSSVAGKVTDISMSDKYDERHPDLSLGIFVMKTVYLRRLIEEAIAYNLSSLTEFMLKNCKSSSYKAIKYNGYVATVSSFLDYYRCSMDLVNDRGARDNLFGNKDARIFTRVHNSSPSVYKSSANVVNSMIADDCVIEGTVINSVLFRGVKVERGAVVRNSVLFSGAHIGQDASVNCIVADKNVYVSDSVNLSGNDNMPFYIQKSRKV